MFLYLLNLDLAVCVWLFGLHYGGYGASRDVLSTSLSETITSKLFLVQLTRKLYVATPSPSHLALRSETSMSVNLKTRGF